MKRIFDTLPNGEKKRIEDEFAAAHDFDPRDPLFGSGTVECVVARLCARRSPSSCSAKWLDPCGNCNLGWGRRAACAGSRVSACRTTTHVLCQTQSSDHKALNAVPLRREYRCRVSDRQRGPGAQPARDLARTPIVGGQGGRPVAEALSELSKVRDAKAHVDLRFE